MTNLQKGIFYMILSAFSFALMGVFLKSAGDLPVIQKMIFRSYIISIASFTAIKLMKVKLSVNNNHKLLIIRSIFGTGGMICAFYSIDKLVLSDATILNKISTFILLIFSSIFLKEKLKKEHLLFIALSFLGVLLIVRPTFDIKTIPYLVSLLGAVLAAGAYTILRVLGKRVHPMVTVFYFASFGAIILTPMAFINFKPMTITQVLLLIGAGLCATIGQFGLSFGYKYASAKEVSIYSYTGVVFSAVFSIIFFGKTPNTLSIFGYIIIFVTAWLMYQFNKKTVEEK